MSNDWPQFDLSIVKPGIRTTILAKTAGQVVPGTMAFFKYKPETKSKNMWFDHNPLVLVYKIVPNGFIGYNIHFLNVAVKYQFIIKFKKILQSVDTPIERIRLADRILPLIESKSPWKDTVRRYKYKNIQSSVVLVHPDYWETAINLPLDKIVKGNF